MNVTVVRYHRFSIKPAYTMKQLGLMGLQ